MSMRKAWACVDIGEAKEPGLYMPVPGSAEEFPDCPAGYLRTAHDVMVLRDRQGGRPFADHLIEGNTHPATLISTDAAEVKSGARSVDSMSPRRLALVHIWLKEEASRDQNDSEMRRAKHG
jgi:hypothetical protein